ncbi:phospholipase D family protein [Rhizorhabdus phycosphaerae]|uniref:phospholipase D family protein n=1 Tax=Rhizorhabdus phycosphaerae TaxID=2711156 RepID=UPI0013EC45F2|nr:phospholipase D family protein [Rhizorhabdus phycosphaerae]
MFRLISSNWEKEVLDARSASPVGLRIICPFIKARTMARILEAGHKGPLEVITRFDLGCFYDGVSDTDALRGLLEAGGTIRGIKGLHAKLFLFAEATAIGTSANVTDAAMLRNHEFGFIADDATIVDECRSYFDRLWKQAGRNLTAARLKDWDTLLAAARKKSGGNQRPNLPDHGAKLPATSPFALASVAKSYDNAAFLKFFGQGTNRSPRTARIADLVADSGCNWACTYPTARRPRQIQDGDILYMARIAAPDDLLIFGSAIGWRHRDDEDVASVAEIEARPWKEKWANYVRVHTARFINAELGVGVSMREMMTELGSDSFQSTQQNAERGSGNTDPFAAYLRKPGMPLTSISREWIDRRIEALFRQHGEVDLSPIRFRAPT